jgi:hypothetical protein
MKTEKTRTGTPAEITPMEAPQEIPTKHDNGDDYELDGVEHGLISEYRPKFLGKGGEQIVYEIPEHPDIVIKVATEPLRKIAEWNVAHDRPLDSMPPELEPHVREYLVQEDARYRQLKKYFGAAHVPDQKEFLMKIPVTKNILRALYNNGSPPFATNEAWSVVTAQKRVAALSDPGRLSIVAGYAEQSDVSEKSYNQATKHLVFGEGPEEKLNDRDFFEVQSYPDLKELLEKSGSDENLKATLKTLVGEIISYAEETGEIFDLAGQDNIVLYQKDGKWTYSLVDTRYPGEGQMVNKARAALLKLSTEGELDEKEKNILLNIFNFVRTVNGLAEQLGAQKRINIVPENANLKEIDFLNMLR